MKVKVALAAAVFFSYIAFVPQIARLDSFANVVQHSLDGSVGVFSICGDKTLYGGGTVVGKRGEILTVAHIVPDFECHVVVKSMNTAETLGAKILNIDTEKDLALITVNTSSVNPVKLAEEKTLAGETIFTVGAPGHLQGTVTKGIVSNNEVKTALSPHSVVYDVTVLPGSSGGGVFDESGRLTGVIKATVSPSDTGNTLAVGIKRSTIDEFLKESMPK